MSIREAVNEIAASAAEALTAEFAVVVLLALVAVLVLP